MTSEEALTAHHLAARAHARCCVCGQWGIVDQFDFCARCLERANNRQTVLGPGFELQAAMGRMQARYERLKGKALRQRTDVLRRQFAASRCSLVASQQEALTRLLERLPQLDDLDALLERHGFFWRRVEFRAEGGSIVRFVKRVGVPYLHFSELHRSGQPVPVSQAVGEIVSSLPETSRAGEVGPLWLPDMVQPGARLQALLRRGADERRAQEVAAAQRAAQRAAKVARKMADHAGPEVPARLEPKVVTPDQMSRWSAGEDDAPYRGGRFSVRGMAEDA